MDRDNPVRESSGLIGTKISPQQIWNQVLTFSIPLLCIVLYLLYPRKLIPGLELSVVVLTVAVVVAVPYVKGRIRWSILSAMVALAVIFPHHAEVKLILAFLSIVTIVMVEYVSRQGIRRLFLAVVFVSTLILILAWIFTLFLVDPAIDPPGVSFFGSKVGFVNILIFGLMCLVYLLLVGGKSRGWLLLYLLAHVFLFTLFGTLSKQVYVAILLYCVIAIPALALLGKKRVVPHLLCSIVAIYFLFSLFGGVNLQSRWEALGLIGSYDNNAIREFLEQDESLPKKGQGDHANRIPECYKSEYYLGCLEYSALCAEDYIRPYLDKADSVEEVMESFFPMHARLAKILGSPAAKKKWLAICSRKIIILDKSDRLSMLINGLKRLTSVSVFGSETLSSLHHLNYYFEEIENYTYYHNFMIDLALEAGLVILLVLIIAILFAIFIAIRGGIESNLLGAMVAAFVGLRLLSGSHYELFYLLLPVALIIYHQYAECAE